MRQAIRESDLGGKDIRPLRLPHQRVKVLLIAELFQESVGVRSKTTLGLSDGTIKRVTF